MNKVVVLKGHNPSEMAYNAMEKIYKIDEKNKTVLLKVNTGFKGKAKAGLTTHSEVVRGAIKFFKDKHFEKIYVGDSSITGVDSMEALEAAGIKDVCQEEGAICVSLNDFEMVRIPIPMGKIVEELKFSKLVFDVDVLVSVPVMKTHMYTGATLSIKNMKGGMYKTNKTVLHRINKPSPDPSKGLVLDFGIAEMARVCYPDYSLIDGIVGMEGFGPSGGTSKELGIIIAGDEPVACDLIGVKLMGMKQDAIPHINIVAEEKGINPEDIQVEPSNYMDYSQKFKLAEHTELMKEYPNIKVLDRGACSGCHAALIAFLRANSNKISSNIKICLCIGKDIKEEEFEEYKDSEIFLIGNCTAKYKEEYPFCKGCAPISSSMISIVNETTEK
jgi:uncharacterized protein (DUF362 family)